ncbi:MAG TPA: amino acid transporter [Acidobacteriaceae bacterium]|nr:amino acid transporter [Acidobacteriaceae bacterium]
MRFKDWLLSDLRLPSGIQSQPEPEHAWWQVMCLTGVDYFSTLGYQPGIAFLAAGLLSPIATLILVLVTLFGALPVYSRVAEASPNGQGSIAMLEKLFPRWKGKIFVLVLLGFATTDFTITMTLSAADAAAHFTHNPFTPDSLKSQMGATLVLLAILGIVFLKGFKEAVRIAVWLVGVYLILNGVVTAVGLWELVRHPEALHAWKHALFAQHSHPLAMIGLSLIFFPKLALGLSGFETGVAVMPLIRGKDQQERIANTRKLLATAAIIMSVFLIATSVITTLLIPAASFQDGGPANGRAVAYLAHLYLGSAFGSLYDVSTILILAFAGASAMAGLLNLIPRYLPRFGMAPEWASASRPLVMVFTGIAFAVTLLFHANVDAQGGAYATGVLVLITSASAAVTIAVSKQPLRGAFFIITLIFVYTTIQNVRERPEGIKIASFFIVAIIGTSLISRALRSTELRITGITLDPQAQSIVSEVIQGKSLQIIARSPRPDSEEDLKGLERRMRLLHCLGADDSLCFFEVQRGDTSDFEDTLTVYGRRIGDHKILFAKSPVVPNAFAALLMELEKQSGKVPHAYFTWTEGNPLLNVLYFVFFGEGDVAPITHEVLRRAIEDPDRRPVIHVT